VGDVACEIGKDGVVIMNLCGRGDKDVFTIADALGVKL
jgi:tryptophan synthase beta chain